MPSPFYEKLVKTVGGFIGEEKAAGTVARRLKDCAATPENFAPAHLKQIVTGLTAAASLYLADAGKKSEFQRQLSSLC